MGNRILEQAPYGSDGIEEFVLPQLIGRSLLTAPADMRVREDRQYWRSEDFWEDVVSETLVAERTVELESMNVFEWFPRNPGLFHTDRARRARKMAQYHIMDLDERKYQNYLADADAAPDHATALRALTGSEGSARTEIFTPKGKMSMLQGGIGCVRYKPFDLKRGGKAWLMTAGSGRAPDEGIPLLVPDALYQRVITEIKDRGLCSATVQGKLRFVQDEFRDLYSLTYRIPRVYVEVEGLTKSRRVRHGSAIVSVAASFLAEIEERPAIYAAYVTFDPGYRGARDSAVDWMQEEYVRGLYKGEMLTDFDQQSPSFSNSLFSLDHVLTSPDLVDVIARLRALHGRFDWDMLERQNINFNVDRRDMRMKVHIEGNASNVVIGGANSTNNLVINQSQLSTLADDLAETRTKLKKEPESDDRDRIAGALADAEVAAKQSNPAGVNEALKRLKPFGKKMADLAEKVGVGLAVAAIKAAVGF